MAFFNDSKFNMWRGCIAMIWIDGRAHPEEVQWMRDLLENLRFTDDQRAALENDLKNGIQFDQVLPLITDKKDRAFLSHQMNIISHLDSDVSAEEKKTYEAYRERILAGLDLAGLEAQIEADEKASYHEDEFYKVENKHSVLENAVRTFQRITNNGDYKFPDQAE